MPYTVNDKKLPKYVKSRSISIRRKWVAIFNKVYEKVSIEI